MPKIPYYAESTLLQKVFSDYLEYLMVLWCYKKYFGGVMVRKKVFYCCYGAQKVFWWCYGAQKKCYLTVLWCACLVSAELCPDTPTSTPEVSTGWKYVAKWVEFLQCEFLYLYLYFCICKKNQNYDCSKHHQLWRMTAWGCSTSIVFVYVCVCVYIYVYL